jgi:hypothetical protein
MGKGSAPSSQNIAQTNLPEYVRPQFERLLGRAEDLTSAEYTPFTGQRVATQGVGDINQAYDITRGVAGSGIAGLPEAAGVLAGNVQAGQQLAQQATPFQFGQAGFSQFQPTGFGGFQAGAADPYAGFREAQFGATGVSPFAVSKSVRLIRLPPSGKHSSKQVEPSRLPVLKSNALIRLLTFKKHRPSSFNLAQPNGLPAAR